MAAVSIMLTALLKNYPRKGNEINQIKPASGPRSSAIDVCRSRATLDVTSGDNFSPDPWRSSSGSPHFQRSWLQKRFIHSKIKATGRQNLDNFMG